MSIIIAIQQVGIIFGYMLVGFIAGKLQIIRPQERLFLSKLITSITLPFTIIAATNVTMKRAVLVNLGLLTGTLFLTYVAVTGVCLVTLKMKGVSQKKQAAYTSLCVYPNSAFIGMPLCTALMGDIGTIYAAGAIAAFNVIFFTLQESLFSGKKFQLKNFVTPVNITTVLMIVMLIFGIHLPAPVQTVCSNIGGMTTPLALIIIGVMISESRLAEIIMEKRAYVLSLIRNIVVPLALLAVLKVLPLEYDVKLATLIFVACPVANLTAVYAMRFDTEAELCARTTLLSTLMFALTLPVILVCSNIL